MKLKYKPLLLSLLLPLSIGAISAFLTRNAMALYPRIEKPFLAPPSILFPIVWTILFLLMGISSYMIYTSSAENRQEVLIVYAIQLLVNFVWPILFFNLQAYLFSFLWILVLWLLILAMIRQFYKVKPLAAFLQLPYLLWVTFAAYLNFMIFLLN